MTYQLGLWIFFLSSFIILAVMGFSWKRRHTSTGKAFLFFMFCAFLWCFFYALELATPVLSRQVFFSKIQFIGIALCSLSWLALVYTYLGIRKPLHYWIVLSFVPLTTLTLVWLFPSPNLFWGEPMLVESLTPFSLVNYDYRFWFYFVHAPYGYVLFLMSFVALIRSFSRTHPIYRPQILAMLLPIIVPFLIDILYVLSFSPTPHINYTSASFSVFCLIMLWALFRHQFLDLLPVARDLVIENMTDGVVVIDNNQRLIDMNPAARSITGLELAHIGSFVKDSEQEFICLVLEEITKQDTEKAEFRLEQSQRVYDVRVSSICDSAGQVQGSVITLRDITEQHRLFRKVEELATLDSMTGFLNRRHFLEVGENEVKRHKEEGSTLCVIMMDMDNLKSVNDTLGHAQGDQAILALTRCAQGFLRAKDHAGRLGGDEFAFLLPETTLKEGLEVAKAMDNGIRDLSIPLLPTVRITASLGLVSSQDYDLGDYTLQELLVWADEVMYEAKARGKNQLLTGERGNKQCRVPSES